MLARVVFLIYLLTFTECHMTKEEMKLYKEKARAMFYHGYNNYLDHAYPYDELKPISCQGQDTWGSYSLTLIDALDTLLIMGNTTEFERVTNIITDTINFDDDINVSVFETNIRVVGGLLSAHLLMHKAPGIKLMKGYPCEGPLLDLALLAAEKLLPAFASNTSMPYGTVNLKHGVPANETPITCTASVGTFILEFGTLSYLTGDNRFLRAADSALQALWKSRSDIGLVGNHINVESGQWTAKDAGIGAGVDSYFENLLKGSVLFANPKLLEMFKEISVDVKKRLKYDDWYLWTDMDSGRVTMPIFQSLEAYWPGVQVLAGEIGEASRTFQKYYTVWRQFGGTPEFYELTSHKAHKKREGYPLRPELIESAMHLYQATQDPFYLEAGKSILESIETISKTPCGYATVKNVNSHELDDRMESFFLAETCKYLYLLFDADNFIHQTSSEMYSKDCFLGSAGYVFNTEAHPIDLAGVHCCQTKQEVYHDSAFSAKDACTRRPFHNKMFGQGIYEADDINIFQEYPKAKT